ncbi:MAG: cytochrome c [Gemmatimonadetes bacterium]|nr:cytochrome c [Gemmatimonadota bacterium]
MASVLWIGLGLIVAGVLPARGQNGGTRALSDGVFSQEQADRGGAVFSEVCAMCHTRGQFTDGSFRKSWQGRTLFDTFEQLRATMPNDSPGRLTRQEYVDVLVYLFSQQGYPAGEQELGSTAAVLRQIRITPPPGGGASSRPHGTPGR